MTTSERYLVWFLAGVLVAAAMAWIAFELQQERVAPAILFPLLVGGGLGAAGVAIRRYTGVPGARTAVAAAVAWGLLVVVAQDYIGHRHRLRMYDEAMSRQGLPAALILADASDLRPRFGDYLAGVVRREPLWWTLDLALTAGSAAIVALLGAPREQMTTSEPRHE